MMKVRDHEHFGRRDLLVVCWNSIPEFFGMFPPKAQWEIHRLYAPSRTLTDDEVFAHIEHTLANEPSLTQRVGKHYKLVFTTFKSYADQVGKTNWEEIRQRLITDYVKDNVDPSEPTRRGKKRIVLMLIVRPEIDTAKLARLLLQLAERRKQES